ncbi:MAG TPA: ATP-grasp domain-containing protein [Acidimicrobiia bacterium]|nr:ATP-grasp domain-containing protein [Acidimicrobiia bacterium]
MNVIFIEPSVPLYQKQFARGLTEAGATVVGIGERPRDWLDSDVGGWLSHYEQVPSVVDVDALESAVRFIQSRIWVDRLEATIEAHVEAAAAVRERCGIPGTSVRTAFLCRDKPAMKEALRSAGVPTAQSDGADNPDELRTFARNVGYPLIIKPRSAAGASGTVKVDNDAELEAAMPGLGFQYGNSVAVEEFIEGHEGFYDTISIGGSVALEFASHYYPNVLEAMRTRWISPVFITTNRIDSSGYDEVKEMGQRVISDLGIETSATHMEWFFGPKGLKFSEIGCRPPGVGAWDLYCAANEMDVYREWANAICYGRLATAPSRRFSAGIIALRPDRDGTITGYEGLSEVHDRFGEWIIDFHLPSPGTPTQPVEAGYMANAWMRLRHPDFDELRSILGQIGETAHVRAS